MIYSYCIISENTVRLNITGGYEYLMGECFEKFLTCVEKGRKITNNRIQLIEYLNYCNDENLF